MSTKQKVAERPAGRGKLFEEQQLVCDAAYELTVSQTIHIARTFGETEEVEGLRSITGRVGADDLMGLFGRSLTLHLEDGRRLNVIITDGKGTVRGNGDFF